MFLVFTARGFQVVRFLLKCSPSSQGIAPSHFKLTHQKWVKAQNRMFELFVHLGMLQWVQAEVSATVHCLTGSNSGHFKPFNSMHNFSVLILLHLIYCCCVFLVKWFWSPFLSWYFGDAGCKCMGALYLQYTIRLVGTGHETKLHEQQNWHTTGKTNSQIISNAHPWIYTKSIGSKT